MNPEQQNNNDPNQPNQPASPPAGSTPPGPQVYNPQIPPVQQQQPMRQPMQQPPQPPVQSPVQPQVELSPEQAFAQEQLSDHDIAKLNRPRRHRFAMFSGIFGIIQLVVGALLLAFFINQFVFQSYQVFGSSMSPTLSEGDRLIISKVSKSWSGLWRDDYAPSRYDIIVFQSPLNPNIQLVKRVIALPGESVTLIDGVLTVYNEVNPNGFNPDEGTEYGDNIADFTDGSVPDKLQIKEGQIFVSGDNREPGGSLDSRNDLGLVPIDNVVGELVLRIFPLGDADFY